MCQGKAALGKGGAGAGAIQPGRRDEARRRPSYDVLDQRLAIGHAGGGLGLREPQKFTFRGGHVLRLDGGKPAVAGQILVEPAMDEHLDSGIGPIAQSSLEGRVLRQRSLAPMIRHHQHGKARAAKQAGQQASQLVDLAFKTRADIVDRGEEQFPAHRRRLPGTGPSSAGSKISAQMRVHTSEIIRISPMLAVPG